MTRIRIGMGIFLLAMITRTPVLATAQDTSTTQTTHKSTRTLTGCLQNGDSANEYLLTTKKGSTWEIESDSVKLGEHVGHTVTITGAVAHAKMHAMKEDAKEEAKEHGMEKKASEHGHMTVADLKMVSESCQKYQAASWNLCYAKTRPRVMRQLFQASIHDEDHP